MKKMAKADNRNVICPLGLEVRLVTSEEAETVQKTNDKAAIDLVSRVKSSVSPGSEVPNIGSEGTELVRKNDGKLKKREAIKRRLNSIRFIRSEEADVVRERHEKWTKRERIEQRLTMFRGYTLPSRCVTTFGVFGRNGETAIRKP